jgi:flagellar basal-body rod protein FlgF
MEIAGNIALSRMMALQQRMDIVANNIANMNTTGYKSIELLMKEDKISPSSNGVTAQDSSPVSMVAQWGTVRNTSGGVIQQTGNPLDVAIQGPGYFTVKDASGQALYTRNGVFQISSTGTLVDLSGNPVQSDGGEINIPPGTTSVSIGSDGTVSTPKGILGRIGVVNFQNEQALLPAGTNDFTAPDGVDAQPVTNPVVVQGSLEQSNVNGINQMTDMIEIQRQYQSAANIVKSENDRLNAAIKDLAKTG